MNLTLLSRLALATACSATLWAGGFYLQLGNPSASSDARAHDAALTVRATGCGEPAKAVLTATAVGLVNGQRRRVELKPVALSTAGMYAIPQGWPREGTWVVVLAGSYERGKTGAVVPVSANGVDRHRARVVPHTPTEAEIDEVLQSGGGS